MNIRTDYAIGINSGVLSITFTNAVVLEKIHRIVNVTQGGVIYSTETGQRNFGATLAGNVLTLALKPKRIAETDVLSIEYIEDATSSNGGTGGGDASAAKQDTQTARLTEIRDKLISTPATEGKQDLQTALLEAINNFFQTKEVTEIPSDDTDSTASAVRALPQHVSRIGYAKAIANGVDTQFFEPAIIGSGQTVNQTGGNLVITTGTTARSETIIRSLASWKGGIRLRTKITLSQRITNQQFIVELVDVIGDNLAYNITSATTMVVTIPTNNPFTAENVGQSVSIGNFAGTGTFLSGRYTIASVSGNDVTFTVSGFTVGTGTCSVFGLNFYRLLYDGTSATNTFYQNQRNGYANASISATINTTASGHIAIITANDLVASFADQGTASATGSVSAVRAQQWENVPDDKDLRLQIRVLNLATAPASTTTCTIGFVSISNFAAQDISIQDVRPTAPQGLPIDIVKAITMAISGTVTANIGTGSIGAGVNAIGDVGLQYRANATGAGTGVNINCPATPAAQSIKGTTGRIVGFYLLNSNAATRWLKIFNVAAPTLGTTSATLDIPIPPSNNPVFIPFSGGIGFSTAIAVAVTGAQGATNNVAVTLNDVSGFLVFA